LANIEIEGDHVILLSKNSLHFHLLISPHHSSYLKASINSKPLPTKTAATSYYNKSCIIIVDFIQTCVNPIFSILFNSHSLKLRDLLTIHSHHHISSHQRNFFLSSSLNSNIEIKAENISRSLIIWKTNSNSHEWPNADCQFILLEMRSREQYLNNCRRLLVWSEFCYFHSSITHSFPSFIPIHYSSPGKKNTTSKYQPKAMDYGSLFSFPCFPLFWKEEHHYYYS